MNLQLMLRRRCEAQRRNKMATDIDKIIPVLKSILIEELNLNLTAAAIDENTILLDGGLELDSIVIVELIGIVESRFDFRFADADLRTPSFHSVKNLAEVIVRRISDASNAKH